MLDVAPVNPSGYDLSFASFRVGGLCAYAVGAGYKATLTRKIHGAKDHKDSTVRLKLTEAPGVQFDFSGVMQSYRSIAGTYSGGGAYCPDSGSFLAKPAVSIAGSYFDVRPSGCITS